MDSSEGGSGKETNNDGNDDVKPPADNRKDPPDLCNDEAAVAPGATPQTETVTVKPVAASATTGSALTGMEDLIEMLARDPELVQMVQQRMATMLGGEAPLNAATSRPTTTEEVSRQVVRTVLRDSRPPTDHHRGRPQAGASSIRSSSPSRSRSPFRTSLTGRGRSRTHHEISSDMPPPPVKTVSFSSISVPQFDSENEQDQDGSDDQDPQRDRRPLPRSSSASPPPPPFPMLLQETSYARGRGNSTCNSNRPARSLTPPCRLLRANNNVSNSGRSMSPVPPELPPSPMMQTSHRSSSRSRSPAIRVRSGESTASGDSSITSSAMHNTGGRTTPTVTFAASTQLPSSQQQQQQLGSSSHHSHVHFSAMNPNPQLVLDDSAHFHVEDLPITNTPTTTPTAVAGRATGTAASAMERSTGTNEGTAAQTVVESETGTTSSGPRVNFTFGRAVSWEDQFARQTNMTNTATTSSSRASLRSGLSSPSIEPALSPITRSRSNSQTIQFNSTIETITEAAARLRRQQREDGTEGEDIIDSSAPTAQDGGQRDTESVGTATRRQASRTVHFSAMREVAVVSTAEAAASSLSLSGMASGASSTHTSVLEQESSLNINQNVASVVHFADDDNYEVEEDSVSTFASAVPSYTEVEMERVAEHLRRLIRRAEEVDSVTLESAFAHFDRSHTGTITPTDLQEGLRRLGDSFSDLTLEDCSALLSCLSKKDRRQKLTANNNTSSTPTTTTPAINLLGFYRAMGRKSPPLIICSDDEEDVAPPLLRSTAPDGPGNEIGEDDNGDNDSAIQRRIGARLHHPFAVQPPVSLESSHVVHADDAASRLREIVLSAEQNEGTPLESSFRLLDPEGTGYIRANDFSSRIRNLGQGNEDTFSQIIDNEDCQELVALFDANNDGLVSLLDFYRFMGRRSPPPEVTSSDDGTNLPIDTSHDDSDHVVEGDAVDAPL